METIHYILIINCILLFCLFSPNIVYLIHKKHFIWKDVIEWGYSTPKQYRYTKGTLVLLLDSDVEYIIIETSRHDYLIRRKVYNNNYEADQRIVLQSEIRLK